MAVSPAPDRSEGGTRPAVVPDRRQRILQIHPSLRCNLTCGHCYSESGPGQELELDPDLAAAAIVDAAGLGYRTLAVSGGEPLLYRGLPRLLDVARDAGMTTTMTTNGLLLRQPRAGPVLDRLDGVAISLDGPPEVHDRIRGRAGAFASIEPATRLLRDRGLAFGFISTLTATNWHHLRWLVEYSVELGAALLQVHPLELVGRARTEMAEEEPPQVALGRAFLLVTALRARYAGQLTIGFDTLLRDQILADPELVYAGDTAPAGDGADLLGLLVVEADGAAVPISYGFSRALGIGNVARGSLAVAFGRWRDRGEGEYRRLCRRVYREIEARPDEQLVNWHERIVAASRGAELAVV